MKAHLYFQNYNSNITYFSQYVFMDETILECFYMLLCFDTSIMVFVQNNEPDRVLVFIETLHYNKQDTKKSMNENILLLFSDVVLLDVWKFL